MNRQEKVKANEIEEGRDDEIFIDNSNRAPTAAAIIVHILQLLPTRHGIASFPFELKQVPKLKR